MTRHSGRAPAVPAERVAPQAIPVRELWPFALLALALVALLYFVALDEGATSLVPGRFVHELVHDGRHLLAAPCH